MDQIFLAIGLGVTTVAVMVLLGVAFGIVKLRFRIDKE